MGTTWRDKFRLEQERRHDTSPTVAVAPDDTALDIVFDNDLGEPEGPHVLVWTEDRVYFPVCYDGAEWFGSAPRHPQPDGQPHVGGG